ncbi:hypothetical protein L486_05769 [Kwoniella mangroviensis CBS 10435]|uniref:Myb-like domain-containing protein n=1 Tax=Kwoniella mangroviensis CBS 10435 TaxID=1331196 RepID=A0A1B9IMX6_9TREE|nr:hypothetical protein L486_05769 [Kwoniella mangroviensis CBS 10435]
MEVISLGLTAPAALNQDVGSAPKKKRTREEKEAKREAKRLKKENQAATAPTEPVPADDDIFNHREKKDSPTKESQKESKEEKARRKAEKAERKARKTNGAATQSENDGKTIKAKPQISSKIAVPPIEPPTQTKVTKREKSQTTPLKTLSQAGPSASSQSPSKRPILTAKPVRQPSTPAKSSSQRSRSNTPRSKSDEKPDDATLKARLKDQKAVEEWLSNNWVSDVELRRLERLDIMKYKKGKLTEDEKIAIRKVLDTYKKVNRLDDEKLIDTIMANTTTFPTGRDGWQAFWLELAGACPGRPVRYVMKMVQRMYDPRGHKGHFTPEEDSMLISAYELHPNQWGKIAEIVERTYHDCRDRYMKELQHRHTRNHGEWTEEEEQKLLEAVKKMNRQTHRNEMDNENIPWVLVVKEMGGIRTVVQCRKKWTDEIYPRKKWGWESGHERENDYKLETLNYPSEKHIKWKEVQDDTLKHMTNHQVRQMYYRMKNKIEDAEKLTYPELVERLKRICENLGRISRKKKPSRPEIDTSDGEDELEEEEGAAKDEHADEKEDEDGSGLQEELEDK